MNLQDPTLRYVTGNTIADGTEFLRSTTLGRGPEGYRIIPYAMTRRSLMCSLAAGLPAPARPRGSGAIRITKVKTVEVRGVPTGKGLVLPWDAKQEPQDTRDYVVTQFVTDQGLIGTTMAGDYKLPARIGQEVQRRAEAYFIGKDPFDIALHNAAFFWKEKPPVRLFFLEIALWDIIGQATGQPLYRIWGAHSSKVKPYAATVHFLKTPSERAEDALKFYELGFRAIKLRLHHVDPKDDLALAETVVKAVGSKMHVMFDANMAGVRQGDPPPAWDYRRALYMARALEEMGVYWLEEPLNRRDLDGLAGLRKQLTKMHLAGAEGNVGLVEFREILSRNALSYIQPDPVTSGTISVVSRVGEGSTFTIRLPFDCGEDHG